MVLLDPYARKAINNKYPTSSYGLWNAEILEVNQKSGGFSQYDFTIKIKYDTFTGPHNPPEGPVILTFDVKLDGVTVTEVDSDQIETRRIVFMDNKRNQVTYKNDAMMGYIYFSEPSKYRITYSEELPENDDIMLDFGKGVPIVGIELEGATARKIKHIAGKANIFKKELTVDGQIYYSFRLNNTMIRKSISHHNADTILFHFSDEKCQDFIGIDILDTELYSEQYLIGK